MQPSKYVGIKVLSPLATTPERGSDFAAGYDVRSIEGATIGPGESRTFRTGLAFDIPEGFMIEAVGRSGLGFKHGIRLSNCIGIIDSDYKGELMFKLHNDSKAPFTVEVGDRVCQIMLRHVIAMSFVHVDELSESARGAGGLGSTGLK